MGRQLDRKFWKGKRILVTGHTGFKGSWLCLMLHELGAKIYGMSNEFPSAPNMFQSLDIVNCIQEHFYGYNLSQSCPKDILGLLNRWKPDVVIHLAAQPIVSAAWENPHFTFENNIMANLNLLDALAQYRKGPGECSHFAAVMITTDKVYDNFDSRPWERRRERDSMVPYKPYDASKACCEILNKSYGTMTGLNNHLSSVRAGNVFGGGDWAQNRLFADMMKGLISNKVVEFKSLFSVRPWQHVLSALEGYLFVAEELYNENFSEHLKHCMDSFSQYGDPLGWWKEFNFGPDTEDCTTIGEIADKLSVILKNKKWFHYSHYESHPTSDTSFLDIDSTKAKRVLGWRPRIKLDMALEMFVTWVKAYKKSPDAALKLTQKQIKEFIDV